MAIDGNNIYALNNKGLALAYLGQYDNAIVYMDKALDISPNDLLLISNKGLVLVELEDTDQALKLVDPFLEENPDDEGLLCMFKKAYEKSDDEESAAYYEEKINALDPDYECKLIEILSSERDAFM